MEKYIPCAYQKLAYLLFHIVLCPVNCKCFANDQCNKIRWHFVYFSSLFLFRWLLVVSCFVLYNCFMVIVRETFDLLNEGVLGLWLTLDYMSDAVYIIDIALHFITSKQVFYS